jgi:phosphatidylserine/phosphatidylglycerophosphate/cardiolipin synthase-like enzyme
VLVLLTLSLALGVTHLAEAPAAPAAPSAQQGASAAAAPRTVAAKVTSADRKRWKAPQGPFFNDPHLKKGWFRIERKVIDTIRHTRKGSTIRIAVYSFDRMPVADALVRAYRRGVKVQMLLNDHQNTRAMKRIRAVIGADRSHTSFIYRCKAGCRSTANDYNNLHSKFYSFSRAGRSEDVLAIGSANMMLNAVLHQWNDLYFSSGDHELFRQFVNLFNNMKKDFDRRRRPRHFCGTPSAADCDDAVDKHTVWAFPRRSGPTDDLVIDMLDKIQCLTPDGAGGVTRTRLALSMHTMRGRRGDYLARAVPEKYAEGCAFRVNYGLIGYHTKKILGAPTVRGRIPLRSTGLDYNTEDNYDLNKDGDKDLILNYYSHQKYLVIRGTYAGVPNTHMVLTGSSNWASLGTANDELWFTIRGKRVARKYGRNYDYQWDHRRNSRNACTTTYATFRVARTMRLPDGTVGRAYVTERRPVTTVEPDRYRKGPYWEAD